MKKTTTTCTTTTIVADTDDEQSFIQQKSNELRLAVKCGDIGNVRNILQSYQVSVDFLNDLILLAIAMGHPPHWGSLCMLPGNVVMKKEIDENEVLEIIKLLIQHGANVNYLKNDSHGYCTPLLLATSKELESVVAFLLKKGATDLSPSLENIKSAIAIPSERISEINMRFFSHINPSKRIEAIARIKQLLENAAKEVEAKSSEEFGPTCFTRFTQ